MSKNAIIFGASSGIGKELARLLVNEGYKVLITGRRIELLKQIQKENPEDYFIQQHDVDDVNATKNLFDLIPTMFQKVDLIVHNAGIGKENYALNWEDDYPTIQTNVVGATRIYQLSYNFFKNQGYGHLVGISSIASLRGNRHVPAYHASKAYQTNYLESLWMKAKRTKKANINITNILPGYVDTDIITGETFWMASVEKATKQILKAIKSKKRKAYITKRWLIIAIVLKIVPARILTKYF